MNLSKWMELPVDAGQKIYFITGEEKYLALRFVEYMVEKHLDGCVPELNFHKIEQGTGLGEIEEKVATLPFMCASRVVLVGDFMGVAGESLNTAQALDDFVSKVPETTRLILMNERVDKRSLIYKYFQKNKMVVETKKLSPMQYDAWVSGFLSERGISISAKDLKHLAGMLGYFNKEKPTTLHESENELKKLAGIVGEGKVLARKDYESLLYPASETNIFKLTDNLSEGRTGAALENLEVLYEMGEPEIKILFMIGRHFRQIMKVGSLSAYGYSKKDIAQTLGIKSDYALNKAFAQSTRMKRADIAEIMDRCLQTELKCKSQTSQPRLAIEVLVCEIGRIIYESRQK